MEIPAKAFFTYELFMTENERNLSLALHLLAFLAESHFGCYLNCSH